MRLSQKQVCLCSTRMPGAQGGQRRVIDPETGVTNRYELACWFWEINLSPLEEYPMLLTAESSFQIQKGKKRKKEKQGKHIL